jgi:hypothetical protein
MIRNAVSRLNFHSVRHLKQYFRRLYHVESAAPIGTVAERDSVEFKVIKKLHNSHKSFSRQ